QEPRKLLTSCRQTERLLLFSQGFLECVDLLLQVTHSLQEIWLWFLHGSSPSKVMNLPRIAPWPRGPIIPSRQQEPARTGSAGTERQWSGCSPGNRGRRLRP